MGRRSNEGFAVGCLFVLHLLASIAVGVFRFREVQSASIDVLSAALPISQVSLLAIWLVLGKARFTWRICGLIAGSAFIFSLLTRTALTGRHQIGSTAVWLDEEWTDYFSFSEAGDYLVRAPLLLAAMTLTLVIWRCFTKRSQNEDKQPISDLLRFRLSDVALWILTICVVLVGVFRTAPYGEWFSALFEHWKHNFNVAANSSMMNTPGYLLIALASLWVVNSEVRFYFRAPVFASVVMGSMFWLVPGETMTGGVVAATITSSLLLVKLYDTLVRAAQPIPSGPEGTTSQLESP